MWRHRGHTRQIEALAGGRWSRLKRTAYKGRGEQSAAPVLRLRDMKVEPILHTVAVLEYKFPPESIRLQYLLCYPYT